MAVIEQRGSTYLNSHNKRICLWYCQLAHVSNALVIKIFRLVDGIDLDIEKKYKPIEILTDLNNLDASNISDQKNLPPNNISITHKLASDNTDIMQNSIAHQTTNINILDKLCMLCIGSKLTKTIRSYKNMTRVINKLEKMHTDL